VRSAARNRAGLYRVLEIFDRTNLDQWGEGMKIGRYELDDNASPAEFAHWVRVSVFSTQAAVAEYIGFDRSTIGRYEGGRIHPPVGYLAFLTELLGEQEARSVKTPKEVWAIHEELVRRLNRIIFGYHQRGIYLNMYSISDWTHLTDVAEAFRRERLDRMEHGIKAPIQPQPEVPKVKQPRNQVFISYSHKDKKWLMLLQTFLKPYIRDELLTVWDDTLTKPGDKWKVEIKQALTSARVAVLLVSPNFLASDFIATDELPPLLKAAEEEGLRIVWIAVSYSAYKRAVIGQYQCANDPSKPLSSLNGSQRNKTLVEVCEFLMEAAQPPRTKVSRQDRPIDLHMSTSRTKPLPPFSGKVLLSDDERYMLRLVREGWSNKELAHKFSLVPGTVSKRLSRIYRKLGVYNRADAVRIALDYKLI
jgi:DNA-binding CsgD family transcriptional regulator/transcriptional regulator with XRE-family HTH domain